MKELCKIVETAIEESAKIGDDDAMRVIAVLSVLRGSMAMPNALPAFFSHVGIFAEQALQKIAEDKAREN